MPARDTPDGKIPPDVVGIVAVVGATADGCEEQALSDTAPSTAKAAARLQRLSGLGAGDAGMINRSFGGITGQTQHRN